VVVFSFVSPDGSFHVFVFSATLRGAGMLVAVHLDFFPST
jgi:hypothetical protein